MSDQIPVPFVRRDLSVEVSKSFLEHRDQTLEVAAFCVAVTNATQNDVATEVLRDLGTLRRGAEKAHKEDRKSTRLNSSH